MFRSLLGSSSLTLAPAVPVGYSLFASMSMPFSTLPRPRVAYELAEEPEDAGDDYNWNGWYDWSWYNSADVETTSMEEALSPPMMTPEKILTRQLAMGAHKEAAVTELTRLCDEHTGLRLHILQYVTHAVRQMTTARDAAMAVKDMVEIVDELMDARAVSRPLRDFLVLALSTEIDPWNKDAFKDAVTELFDEEPSEKILSQIFLSYRCLFSTNISNNLQVPGRRRPRDDRRRFAAA